ncbi:MAG: hypothetical protein KIPDCIKN_04480 [Haliscomenobacter sp.]|nr:hypothetical protein [Haliscomenobacter sp.]
MKNSFNYLLGILALLLVTLIPKASAQDCGCSAALAKDRIESSDEGFDYLHSLSEITESEYEAIKRSGGGGFKFEIISGSANYADFKEKVRTEIHKTELKTGRQYNSSRYEARTSPIAYEAWGKCMESCNKTGLILWIQNESKSSLALLLKYKAGPNDPKSINYSVIIQHGNGTVETMTGRIVANGTEPIAIKRKCASENSISQTTISVKGANYSSDWITSKFYCGSPPPPSCGDVNYNEVNKKEGSMQSNVRRYDIDIAKPYGEKCVKLLIATRWDSTPNDICSYKVKLMKGDETIRVWNPSKTEA